MYRGLRSSLGDLPPAMSFQPSGLRDRRPFGPEGARCELPFVSYGAVLRLIQMNTHYTLNTHAVSRFR